MRQIYEATYHGCGITDQSVFQNMHLRLVETGCVLTTRQEQVCDAITDQKRVDLEDKIIRMVQENLMTDQERVDREERIIGMVQENPRISTRDIAIELEPQEAKSGVCSRIKDYIFTIL